MTEKQTSFKEWLLPVLVSLLLLVAGANFFQNRNTQRSVETMQIQQAVLSNQLSNHFQFAKDGIATVKENEKRLDIIESTYMTRTEVLHQLDLMRDFMEKNYVRK